MSWNIKLVSRRRVRAMMTAKTHKVSTWRRVAIHLSKYTHTRIGTSTTTMGTRLVCDPAYILDRITLVRLGLVK